VHPAAGRPAFQRQLSEGHYDGAGFPMLRAICEGMAEAKIV
jgi:hypothetical protein